MLNSYTQIIVDEFRKHEAFSQTAKEWLELAEEQGMTTADREGHLAESMKESCLRAMRPIKAPVFAHELVLKAFDQIDWRAAARLLYLVDPEAN